MTKRLSAARFRPRNRAHRVDPCYASGGVVVFECNLEEQKEIWIVNIIEIETGNRNYAFCQY